VSVASYGDVAGAVNEWLATTSVAALVTRASDGGLSIWQAMPTDAPLPSVVTSRVGGGPTPGSDLPEDTARISHQCWGSARSQARALAIALVGEAESLARNGTGFTAADGTVLMAAEVLLMMWLPDPDSDTPRYIVDAVYVALHQ
jgi:hypothetical protein